MRTPAMEHTRAERLREHAAAVAQARSTIAAMGAVVRGREARAREGDGFLEVQFARTEVDGRALPAAVWVALRRDDVDAAIEAMTGASQTPFVIEEREEIGDGYRLHHVQDTLPLPEPELLIAQLGRALDVPPDVLTVVADWGVDDPRAASEIEDLLSRRFGPPRPEHRAAACTPARGDAATAGEPSANLTMTVADTARVLRLDDDQRGALEILVSKAAVTLTS